MTSQIRPGSRKDSALCWEICFSAVRDGAAAHYTQAQRRAWVPEDSEPPWMAERLAAGTTWIALNDGRATGFLTGTGIGTGSGPHLDLFFVRPERHGLGDAARLYEAFASAAGDGRLTAHASHFLRPFLVRRGWRVVRADPGLRGGQVLMRFEMERPAR